jgi:hypothetical protein
MTRANYMMRAAKLPKAAIDAFGILGNLPGLWHGSGFNLIAKPNRGDGVTGGVPFTLDVRSTEETLEFATIGGDVPNRGDSEKTIFFGAVRYLQTVFDCADETAIHKEDGMWLHLPGTAESARETYVRQSVIPHGNSLVAQSTAFGAAPDFLVDHAGGPIIRPVNSLPFPIKVPPVLDPIPDLNDLKFPVETDPKYIGLYSTTKVPRSCLPPLDPSVTDEQIIRDPTIILRAVSDPQDKAGLIRKTSLISVSTHYPDPVKVGQLVQGIVNIPFIIKNANAIQLDAIFWIEQVQKTKDNPDNVFLQLQYVQRVILDFQGLHWPHFSVANLVKTG